MDIRELSSSEFFLYFRRTGLVERLLSLERLSRYQLLGAGDRIATVRHYEYNTRLSEAFYTPLQGLETCLRNSLSIELTILLGVDWYENKHGIFQHPTTEMIAKAKQGLQDDGKAIVASRMIPELNFGFWVSILSPRYDTRLWVPALRKAFPNRPKGEDRKAVHKAINAVRRLRNRVAHHEPILHRKLDEDHELILKLILWCCPKTSAWVGSLSRLPAVLTGK